MPYAAFRKLCAPKRRRVIWLPCHRKAYPLALPQPLTVPTTGLRTAFRNSTADDVSGSNSGNMASPSRNVLNLSAIPLETPSEERHEH
eukprot:4069758-Pleurochrysis_carterae.AAC.2